MKSVHLKILLLALFSFIFVKGNAQTVKLDVPPTINTLKLLIEKIEKETDYSFIYNGSVSLSQKVAINVKQQSVDQILKSALANTNLTHEIKAKQIILKVKSNASPSQRRGPRTITGKVMDVGKETIIGSNILIKGTKTGAVTDFDGNFSITVPDVIDDPTLVISYMGFETQEIEVKGRNNVVVTLREGGQQLGEVVVVGYGSQKKESVVGSVQTMRPSELKVPSSNLSNSFAGRLAGVISVQRSGEPGADGSNFWIRGISTMSDATDPLIIIDGVEANSEALNSLAPEMIESFSVLKDATATALYGSRGANGVMIVTTKSGVTDGKPIINVRVENNFNTPVRTPRVVDGVSYMELYNEALAYRGGSSTKTPYELSKIEGTRNGYDPLTYPNVNWYDEMFNDMSMSQNVFFNVRGGGDKADYYLGVNVAHEAGILKNLSRDYYSYDNNIEVMKYTFQNNVNVKLTPTSKVSLRLNVQLRDYSGPKQSTGSIFSSVMKTNPVDFPIAYPQNDPRMMTDGFREYAMWGGAAGSTSINPVQDMTNGLTKNFRSTVTANLSFDQKLDFVTKGLSANLLASFKNHSTTENQRFYDKPNSYIVSDFEMDGPNATSYTLSPIGTPQAQVLEYKRSNDGNRNIFLQGQINYDRIFDKVHSVQGMLVYNQSEYSINAPDSFLNTLPKRTQSIAGRASYAYANKYLAEVNFGYNGSENFAKGKRWGFFPSIALGYNISEESFWDYIRPVISSFKIRGSYGLVGNDKIGSERFAYLANITLQSDKNSFTTGYDSNLSHKGPLYNRYENNNITWEIGKKANFGIDMQILNDFNIMVDIFSEDRDGIFRQRGTIPSFLGTGDPSKDDAVKIWGNLARVLNVGGDMSINYDKQLSKDWFLSLRGTFTYAHNTILDLDEPVYQLYPGKSQVGHQIKQNQLLIADGLFANEEELRNYWSDYGVVYPGDIRYKDIANAEGYADGRITDDDKIYTGYPTTPEIVYGFGANLKYKKFDFAVFFQGTGNVSLLMNDFHPFGTSQSRNTYNVLDWVAANRWSEANPDPNAEYPALSLDTHPNSTVGSTFWLRDASFLKLKNVELGFTHKFFRAYISGVNLLTFSEFKHWDPEQGGGSGYKYPNQRTFNIGLQMNF